MLKHGVLIAFLVSVTAAWRAVLSNSSNGLSFFLLMFTWLNKLFFSVKLY